MNLEVEVHRIGGQLREIVAELQAAHARAAEAPALHSPKELERLASRRDVLVGQLGSLVGEQLLAGGPVQLRALPSGSGVVVAPVHNPAAEDARAALDALSPVEEIETPDQLRATYAQLRRIASHPAAWDPLPDPVVRSLLGATICMLREVQEANEDFGRLVREPEIVGLLSRLSHWSKERRPGWVNGLARGAEPVQESWLDDALDHVAQLERWIAAHTPTPTVANEPERQSAPAPAEPPPEKWTGEALRAAIVAAVSKAGELTSAELHARLGGPKSSLLANLRKVVEAGQIQRTNPAPQARNQTYVPSASSASSAATRTETVRSTTQATPEPEPASTDSDAFARATRARQAKWEALSLGKPCPACGVDVGEWCRSSGGKAITHTSHMARRD